jgi:hypothetical protein
MAEQEKRSQKELALTYGGDTSRSKLDYMYHGHWFRRFRLILFVLAVLVSLGVVFGYSLFVGPSARARWNSELNDRVATALKEGKTIDAPWNPEELFNTGPISENHSRLADGCQACHPGSNPNITQLLGFVKSTEQSKLPADSPLLALSTGLQKEGAKGLVAAYQKLTKLQQMDAACISCHVNYQQLPVHLHLPQSPQLHLAKVSFPFPIVSSGACSSCHKEHVGHGRMANVSSDTCRTCHGTVGEDGKHSVVLDVLKDPARGKVFFPTGPEAVVGSANAQVGEGISRFLVWRAPGRTGGFDDNWLVPFRFYGPADPHTNSKTGWGSHPPFRYELPTARDPSRILYGHKIHEQPKVANLFKKILAGEEAAIPGVPVREWLDAKGSQNCLFCHESGPDGEYRQQINYERHCQVCHRMDIVVPPLQDAKTGKVWPFTRIQIPHRDPEKVRAFFDNQNLLMEFERAAYRAGYTDQQTRLDYVTAAFTNLKNREISNPLELLRRVFYTGDPAYESWRKSTTTNKAMTACALCHRDMLNPPKPEQYTDISKAPTMLPINLANRWVNHGPFTHEPHKHMKCIDCHANGKAITANSTFVGSDQPGATTKDPNAMTYSVKSAHDSTVSADILMPRQRLCEECHRPMSREAAATLADPNQRFGQNATSLAPEARTAFQAASGGIKYECLDCHKFHAPAEAMPLLKQLKEAAPAKVTTASN